MQALVDHVDGDLATARSMADAHEIDRIVRVAGGGTLRVGQFAKVTVTGADAHDLSARLAR